MSSQYLADSFIRETNYNVLAPKTPPATLPGGGEALGFNTGTLERHISTRVGMTTQNSCRAPPNMTLLRNKVATDVIPEVALQEGRT